MMAKQFNRLALPHRQFIAAQHMFLMATAAPTGRVNLSPKGTDSLRVVDATHILWRNATGSGNETAGHLRQTPRMTLMWCAVDGPPLILRCYGTARATHLGDPDWATLNASFPPDISARQIFELTIDLVQTSCGFSVPLMQYKGERPDADAWTAAKGPDGILAYWDTTNRKTIDGFDTGIEANL